MPTWALASFQVRRVLDMLVSAFSSLSAGDCTGRAVLAVHLDCHDHIRHALCPLVSLIVFVMAFIPIFGPYISGAIGTLLILPLRQARHCGFADVFVVQQLEGSLVYPRIMSSAVDMPSIWILVAVTLGGGIMGIVGMFIFIPLAAVGYRILGEETSQREKRAHKDAAKAVP